MPAFKDLCHTGVFAVKHSGADDGLRGAAPIARVEVSVGESEWEEARLEGEPQRGSWRRWELTTRLDQAGTSNVRARAIDQAEHTQPERAEWNNLGYGNNSIQRVPICAV